MLVLRRRDGESIVINKDIFVTIMKIKDGVADVVVDAPNVIKVDRLEVHQLKNSKKFQNKTEF